MSGERGDEAEKSTRVGPKSSVTMALAGTIALGGIYLGKVEMRVESLEQDRAEVRADVKQLLQKVDDIRVHIAAMDRRTGVIERPISEVKRIPSGD